MNKIAIIYICTGKYTDLWVDFYRSSQENLLPNHKKIYHLFTDCAELSEKLTNESDCAIHRIKHEAWPGPSLHRYRYIWSIREELRSEQCEMVIFFNANSFFHRRVNLSDIGINSTYQLFGVQHPGYAGLHAWLCPYERRKRLSCYVPWSYRGSYLQGCLQGGHTEEVIQMAEMLSNLTEIDTRKGLMARWHDESYWNHWATFNRVKVLPTGYAAPWNEAEPYPPNAKILMRIKPKGYRPSNEKPDWLRLAGRTIREALNKLAYALSR